MGDMDVRGTAPHPGPYVDPSCHTPNAKRPSIELLPNARLAPVILNERPDPAPLWSLRAFFLTI